MALTKQFRVSEYTIVFPGKEVIVRYSLVVQEDGDDLIQGKTKTRKFFPGQIEELKSFTGLGNQNVHIAHINNIWS